MEALQRAARFFILIELSTEIGCTFLLRSIAMKNIIKSYTSHNFIVLAGNTESDS